MNKLMKVGLVALVASLSVQASAEEVETEKETEVVGWTPIAFGIASPVQLPWGSHQWDIFGLGVNLLWTDAPKMYGLGLGGIAMATRDDLKGLQVSGLCNWAEKDVYGVRASLGANISFGKTYGFEVGAFSYREGDMWGWDTELVCSYQPNFWGVQISGILNLTLEQSYGCSLAVGGNMSKVAYGCQLAGVFNMTEELHGCQIGVVNYAKECPWGFQIGLVNIIMDNKIKVLPIVNAYF